MLFGFFSIRINCMKLYSDVFVDKDRGENERKKDNKNMRRFKVPKQKPRKVENLQTESTRNQWTARAKCVCGYGTEMSWWWPWCIVMVTTGIRICYVMLPENWWILHPDEIFQSVEVAFSEVYGYGFRPYEYLPAPNDTTIPAKAQLLQSGMYGLRSSIYPKIFVAVLSVAKMSGLDHSAFMLCRIFNVVITSLLPVAVYCFVLKMFHCRLLALLTCALSAVECHLAVFGTHTIVNSFISPGIFAGLALTLGLHDDETTGNVKEELQELADNTSDLNGNIISKYVNNGKNLRELQQIKQSSTEKGETEKEEGSTNHVKWVKKDRLLASFSGGFLLGVICYVRPDSVLFCSSITLSMFCLKRRFVRQYCIEGTTAVIGGVAACMLCVADDFSWYGWGVISPIQWLKFNIMSGKSGKLFGIQEANLYLQVFTDSAAHIIVNLTFATILIYSKTKQADALVLPRVFCAICFTFISNLIVFSSAGHKEKRFIHNIIVLYLLIVSYSLHTLVSLIRRRFAKTYSSFITVSFVISFTILSYSRYPTVKTLTLSDWTYGEARDSADVNTCLDWLRRQNDVNGVHVNASLYDTAGFAILKHDVPLLVKMHSEFYLFDGEMERKSLYKNRRIRTILNYSDFIHESNKLYLARLLSKGKLFNYIITKTELFSSPHIKYTYNKVFTRGNFNIFRTDFSLPKEKEPTEPVSVGDNATVLEYEANWLITNALYKLAIERIEGALKLDKSRVRLYQQMFVCYYKLNDKKMLFHYQEECFRRFGKQACVTQQEKVVLHEDYHRVY